MPSVADKFQTPAIAEGSNPSEAENCQSSPHRAVEVSALNAVSALNVELKIGDWVRVHTASAIEATLDQQCAIDGVPMMPEMLAHCGKLFQIARFANKLCANVGGVEIRSMQNVVVLRMNRCDGCFHGGCQMGCDYLWKLDWLTKVDAPSAEEPNENANVAATDKFLNRLVQLSDGDSANRVTKSSGKFFRCQSTELKAATRQSSPFHFGQYLVDQKSNRTSALSIARFLSGIVLKKIVRRGDSVVGPCRKTPATDLSLQIGDQVKVKSFEEIVKTLDRNGCNRGLWFDPAEMKPFCGRTLTVTRRIDRIIHEQTGELLEMKVPSIVLDETQCSGVHRRFCSRGMLHFWREVWLEKSHS